MNICIIMKIKPQKSGGKGGTKSKINKIHQSDYIAWRLRNQIEFFREIEDFKAIPFVSEESWVMGNNSQVFRAIYKSKTCVNWRLWSLLSLSFFFDSSFYFLSLPLSPSLPGISFLIGVYVQSSTKQKICEVGLVRITQGMCFHFPSL